MKRLCSLLVLLSLAGVAEAGAPLICFPIDIGDRESLPFGEGNAPLDDYPLAKLEADTLRLLDAKAPIPVRMETLRRVTFYAAFSGRKRGGPKVGLEILHALTRRAMDAEAAGKPSALAWFDAGYLVETFRQIGLLERDGPAYGYTWIRRAGKLGLKGAAYELACALACTSQGSGHAEPHLERLASRTKPGDPLRAVAEGVFGSLEKRVKPKPKQKPKAKGEPARS